jgi:hypothetical protein
MATTAEVNCATIHPSSPSVRRPRPISPRNRKQADDRTRKENTDDRTRKEKTEDEDVPTPTPKTDNPRHPTKPAKRKLRQLPRRKTEASLTTMLMIKFRGCDVESGLSPTSSASSSSSSSSLGGGREATNL